MQHTGHTRGATRTTTAPGRRHRAPAWLLALALAACGGGGAGGAGGDSTDGGAAPNAAAPAAAGSGASSTSGTSGTGTGAGTGTTTVPAGTATPATPPVTAEQFANEEQAGEQANPSIAWLRDGGHVVAWTSQAGRTDGIPSVCWRRYTGASAPAGPQACRAEPDVAGRSTRIVALPDGGWVLAWHAFDEGSSLGVRTLRFGAGGQAEGQPAWVNTTRTGDQAYADMAALAGGGRLVVWLDNDTQSVVAQRQADDGTLLGGPVRVDGALPGASRSQPRVAALAGGGWVVVWLAMQPPTSGAAIYGRRYAADGTPAGPEALLSDADVTGLNPRVAGLAGGGWVLAWNAGSAAAAQRYAADGTPVGPRIGLDPVHLATAPDTCYRPYPTSCPPFQVVGAVTALPDGGWVAAWGNSTGISLSRGVFGRRYAADGTALGAAPSQLAGTIAADVSLAPAAAGFLLVATGQDQDGPGVLLRRWDDGGLR